MPRWPKKEAEAPSPTIVRETTIIHEYAGDDSHRLIVEGSTGYWYPHEEIAQQDGYFATTSYHEYLNLPGVFTVAAQGYMALLPSPRTVRHEVAAGEVAGL